MKLRWNFACVSTKSLKFEIYFLSFSVLFQAIIYVFSFQKNVKMTKIFKITLVQIFVHWNLKLLHLISDFVLIQFMSYQKTKHL